MALGPAVQAIKIKKMPPKPHVITFQGLMWGLTLRPPQKVALLCYYNSFPYSNKHLYLPAFYCMLIVRQKVPNYSSFFSSFYWKELNTVKSIPLGIHKAWRISLLMLATKNNAKKFYFYFCAREEHKSCKKNNLKIWDLVIWNFSRAYFNFKCRIISQIKLSASYNLKLIFAHVYLAFDLSALTLSSFQPVSLSALSQTISSLNSLPCEFIK